MALTVADEKRRAMLSYIQTFEPAYNSKSQSDTWRKYLALKASTTLEIIANKSTSQLERTYFTAGATESLGDAERRFYLNFLGNTAANNLKSTSDLEYAYWKAQP